MNLDLIDAEHGFDEDGQLYVLVNDDWKAQCTMEPESPGLKTGDTLTDNFGVTWIVSVDGGTVFLLKPVE